MHAHAKNYTFLSQQIIEPGAGVFPVSKAGFRWSLHPLKSAISIINGAIQISYFTNQACKRLNGSHSEVLFLNLGG
jgi:hypothetical protein